MLNAAHVVEAYHVVRNLRETEGGKCARPSRRPVLSSQRRGVRGPAKVRGPGRVTHPAEFDWCKGSKPISAQRRKPEGGVYHERLMISTLPVDRVDELTLHGPFLYTSLPFLHLTSPRCPERRTPRFERDQLYITHLRPRKTASPTFLNHLYAPSNQSPAYIAPSSTHSSIVSQLSSLSHFAMHGRRNAVSTPPWSPTGFVEGRDEPPDSLHRGRMKLL